MAKKTTKKVSNEDILRKLEEIEKAIKPKDDLSELRKLAEEINKLTPKIEYVPIPYPYNPNPYPYYPYWIGYPPTITYTTSGYAEVGPTTTAGDSHTISSGDNWSYTTIGQTNG